MQKCVNSVLQSLDNYSKYDHTVDKLNNAAYALRLTNQLLTSEPAERHALLKKYQVLALQMQGSPSCGGQAAGLAILALTACLIAYGVAVILSGGIAIIPLAIGTAALIGSAGFFYVSRHKGISNSMQKMHDNVIACADCSLRNVYNG